MAPFSRSPMLVMSELETAFLETKVKYGEQSKALILVLDFLVIFSAQSLLSFSVLIHWNKMTTLWMGDVCNNSFRFVFTT